MKNMAEALEESSYTDDLRLYREYDDEIIEHNTPLTDYVKKATSDMINNPEPVSSYNERHIADILSDWQKTSEDKINPSHYKNVAAGLQYMQLMVDMLERFNGVEAHLMGQIYKYLMRSKLKDPFTQDLEKAKWYLDALIMYSKEGKVM